MGLLNWKKNSKKAELSREEIDQLKEQLDEKMGEFKTIYHDFVEAGGTELPEDILESVSGGLAPIPVTTPDMYGTWSPNIEFRQFQSEMYKLEQQAQQGPAERGLLD